MALDPRVAAHMKSNSIPPLSQIKGTFLLILTISRMNNKGE